MGCNPSEVLMGQNSGCEKSGQAYHQALAVAVATLQPAISCESQTCRHAW